MKVTSLKDVESYIYSAVILPLKGLNTPSIELQSPLGTGSGQQWSLGVQREPLTRRYRRNYQRTLAYRQAKHEVILFAEGKEYVVATYNQKNHFVKVYIKPFRRLKAQLLFGKLCESFSKNTPFVKVITELEAPRRVRSMEDGPMPALSNPFRDDAPEEGGWRYDE